MSGFQNVPALSEITSRGQTHDQKRSSHGIQEGDDQLVAHRNEHRPSPRHDLPCQEGEREPEEQADCAYSLDGTVPFLHCRETGSADDEHVAGQKFPHPYFLTLTDLSGEVLVEVLQDALRLNLVQAEGPLQVGCRVLVAEQG